MIDDERAQHWAEDAHTALTHYYGKHDLPAHLAVIVLTLLEDRREREAYIEGTGKQSPETAN